MASEYEWDTLRVLRGVSEGRMIRYSISKQEPLYVELQAFVNAILNDTPVPIRGEDGLQALKLAQSLVKSGTEHVVAVLN
jgi:predicted dehydrogenase